MVKSLEGLRRGEAHGKSVKGDETKQTLRAQVARRRGTEGLVLSGG